MSASAKTQSPEAPRPIPPAEHVRRLVEANRVEEARQYLEERRRGETPPHARDEPRRNV